MRKFAYGIAIVVICLLAIGCVAAEENEGRKIAIKINDGEVLTATLENNTSAQGLAEKLRQGNITLEMEDFSNFEKVGELGFDLPVNDEEITTSYGDLILYQGDKLTIYYDTNTYNFTKIGHIDNITQDELKEVLGEGNVRVSVFLEEK